MTRRTQSIGYARQQCRAVQRQIAKAIAKGSPPSRVEFYRRRLAEWTARVLELSR